MLMTLTEASAENFIENWLINSVLVLKTDIFVDGEK